MSVKIARSPYVFGFVCLCAADLPYRFVCSPQARVGTTTTARLQADYHLCQGRSITVYDTDSHGHALSCFFPESSVITDLTRTRGQMALFDGLLSDGHPVRIVDVSAIHFANFITLARQLDWFAEARRLRFDVELLFVTDLSPVALMSARRIGDLWPDLYPIVVTDVGAGALAQPLEEALAALPGTRTFEIRSFIEPGRGRPEVPALSLRGEFFVKPGPISHQYLRQWITDAFDQFHCHEMRAALAQVTSW
jgi:hypothetical protein